MNISRRSFLKMAGLTTVAAAGAAMFTGCVAASYFQISNSDKSLKTDDMTDEEYQANLDKINAALKAAVVPFVNKIKVEDVQKYINEALKKSNVAVPEGESIKINNKTEDGYIYAEGNGIGCITIDISIVKKSA